MKNAHFELICAKLRNLESATRGHSFTREQMQELSRLVRRFADVANSAYMPPTRASFTDLSRIK